jgi:prepilin-type N-terminal cleavage/methylation domain-containing protein
MKNRKAFSLVELLVVIGILAVLMAIIAGLFAGSTESARVAKCMSNMRSLAMASSIVAKEASRTHALAAGSRDGVLSLKNSSGKSSSAKVSEFHGWLSWDSKGKYPASAPIASASMLTSAYNTDIETRIFAYTNGTFYTALDGNIEIFKCPTHVKLCKKENPGWSYVMNANYGWASRITGKSPPKATGPNDRRLMFAELPFLKMEGQDVDTSASSGFINDCTLQFEGCGTEPECIGFNHRTNKKLICAHVVFADAHVERLVWPRGGMSKSELQELTKWLCTGKSVSYNGREYEELK